VSLVDVERLREIAEVEFVDIVVEAIIPDINELRVILTDGSFVDVWFSLKLQDPIAFTGNDVRLMGRSTAMTTHRTSAGNQWRPSPSIFTTVAK
jgi:hypothetical protein